MKASAYLGAIHLMLACVLSASALAQAPRNPARTSFPIPSSVRVVRDIPYAKYDARELTLDLYLPPEADRQRPIPGVIVVRGGGWRSGDKDALAFIAGQLANEGFVAASIEYRTSSEAKFPAAVNDVKAAVRWMRAHATTYRIDPDAIGALGGSAGGHLVAMLATSGGVSELEGSGGNGTTSSRVQAVVAMACVCNLALAGDGARAFIGDPPAGRAAAVTLGSPVTHVNSESAPLLLLHSRTDPVVPFAQSVEIDSLYRRAGAVSVLKEIDAPQAHAFWNDAQYFPETMNEAVAFLRKHLEK